MNIAHCAEGTRALGKLIEKSVTYSHPQRNKLKLFANYPKLSNCPAEEG